MLKPGAAKGKSLKSRRDKPDKGGVKTEKNAIPKKKKTIGATSLGDLSQLGSEDPKRKTELESHSAAQDSSAPRKKKPLSKECEEIVDNAVSDFFECAWKACAERFFITTAPITVSVELRNTWLRIVEAEWQDPDMREKPSTKPNRIFRRDEPPLPLAFDTWSRGAMEPLPSVRRESTFDPFLRDFDQFGQLAVISDPLPASTDSADELEEDKASNLDSVEAQNESLETAEEEIQPIKGLSREASNWNFDLDPIISDSILNKHSSESHSSFGSRKSNDHQYWMSPEGSQYSGIGTEEKHVQTVLSARTFTGKESTTDFDISSATTQSSEKSGSRKLADRKRSRKPKPVKKFSPSQCGGRDGSGVYRLPLETTSEAVLRMQKPYDEEMVSESRVLELNEGVVIGDIAKVSRRGEIPQIEEEDDDLVVQPLFEERTPRATTIFAVEESEEQDEVWKPRSYNEAGFKGHSLSLYTETVASDLYNRLLRRRLVNLHGRFKRQALRAMAANIRKANKKPSRLSSPTNTDEQQETERSSILSSTKKGNEKLGVAGGVGRGASYSSSIPNLRGLEGSSEGTTPDMSYYLANLKSTAKGTASEPLLNSIIRKHQEKYKKGEAMSGRGGKRGRSKYNNGFGMMGNVRREFGSGIAHGKFSTSTGRANPYEPKMKGCVAGGKRRGAGQGQQRSNWRIAYDYDYNQCTVQRNPSDCQSTGTCSNSAIHPT